MSGNPRDPEYWTKERRARQSAIARRAWAQKPKHARSRRKMLADEIDDEEYVAAMAAIATEVFARKASALLNMTKERFVELAVAGGVDPETAEAVRARFICETGDDDER